MTNIVIESKNVNDSSHAMLEKPPNHCLFDVKRSSLSPVLQRHLDMQSKGSTSTTYAPVFNFTIGNELTSLFRPQIPQPASTLPCESAPGPAPFTENAMLIPSGHAMGPDMPIIHFCLAYQLDDSIAEKFMSHLLKEARLLHSVHFADLKEMGFKFGEVAALRDVIEKWSTPAV
jgi:hypothetical protein